MCSSDLAARRGSEPRYESLPAEFHERVRAGFLEIARREPGRCVVIDGTQGIDAVTAAIVRAVSQRLAA